MRHPVARLGVALALVLGGIRCGDGDDRTGGTDDGTGDPVKCCAPKPACIAVYRGSYEGSYAGAASGTWAVRIDARGAIDGSGVRDGGGAEFGISGAVDHLGFATFDAASGGVAFEGRIFADGRFVGIWADGSGTARGARVEGSIEAAPCAEVDVDAAVDEPEPRLDGGSHPRFRSDADPSFGTAELGDPCESDSDCLSEFFCLDADDEAAFGGIAPRGMCVADCMDDPIRCLDFDAICLAARGALQVCLPACQVGLDYGGKCRGREDLVCVPTEQPPLGFCQPLCTSDAACPAGTVCDLSVGLCSSRSPIAGPGSTGASCSTASDCAGYCAGYAELDYASCTSLCTVGHPTHCGRDVDGISEEVCSALTSGSGFGDVGYCVEVCSCNEECSNPDAICYSVEGVPDVPGVCDAPFGGNVGTPCAPTPPDAGVNVAADAAVPRDGGVVDGGSVDADPVVDAGYDGAG